MGHCILPPIFLRWGREKMEKSLNGGDWGTMGKGMAGTPWGHHSLRWKVALNSFSTKFSSTKYNYVLDFQQCHGMMHCFITVLFCFMLPWCTFYAAIITHPHKWQFSCRKILFANIHQCPVQAPVGMFMSAFCNSSNRHLSDLSKMLSLRFLSADAVSLGFVQIFFLTSVIQFWLGSCF